MARPGHAIGEAIIERALPACGNDEWHLAAIEEIKADVRPYVLEDEKNIQGASLEAKIRRLQDKMKRRRR